MLRPDRKWLVLSLVLTIGGAIGTLAVPVLSQNLINDGIGRGNLTLVIEYGGYMLILTLVAAGCQIANTMLAVRFSERTAHHLRTAAFDRIQQLSFGNLDRFRPGNLLIRLTNDIQNIKIGIQQAVINLALVPVMLIIAALLIVFRTPALIWLVVVLLVVSSLLLLVYLWLVLPLFAARQNSYDEMNTSLQENLAGIRVVKAFVRQKYENERFSTVSGKVQETSTRAQNYIAVLIPTLLLVINLSLAAIFYTGGMEVIAGAGFSVGEVVASVQLLFLLIAPFMILSTVLPAISAAKPSLSRIFEILDTPADVIDREKTTPFDPSGVRGRIVFDHVSFAYRGPDGTPGPLVLHDICFAAEPGEMIGFLGSTGSGKSTLVHLIPRFYDVTAGKITIDGVDIREIPQEELRKVVGICLQQPNLFFGTIRENILFAATDRSDGNMIASLEDADAAGFIENLPCKYDDVITRHGANFSGGQRQRLAIARTLAIRPRILILDDSTSSCDVATEARIQDAVNRRMTGVTKLVVAQRISTVISADRSMLLENGRISVSGRHEELLRTSQEYQEIYDSQLGKGIIWSGSS